MNITYLPNKLCVDILENKLCIDSNEQAMARYLISHYSIFENYYQLSNYDYNYYIVVNKSNDLELFQAIEYFLDIKENKRKKFFIGISYNNNDNHIYKIEVLKNKREYLYSQRIYYQKVIFNYIIFIQ